MPKRTGLADKDLHKIVKTTGLSDAPWKELQRTFSSLHKIPFVQAFINYLNEVNEGNWESRTRELILAFEKSEKEAEDSSHWFSNPAFYNGDGSSRITAKTILNYRDLVREPLKTLAAGEDPEASILGFVFIIMLNALSDKGDLSAISFLEALKHSRSTGSQDYHTLQEKMFSKLGLGVLDSILVAMIFLLLPIHQQGRLSWCEECGKLFFRTRRSQHWCSKKCRDRVYNRPSRIAKASKRKIERQR